MMQLPAAKRFAAGSFCPRGLKMLTRAAVFGTLDARDSGDDRREFYVKQPLNLSKENAPKKYTVSQHITNVYFMGAGVLTACL